MNRCPVGSEITNRVIGRFDFRCSDDEPDADRERCDDGASRTRCKQRLARARGRRLCHHGIDRFGQEKSNRREIGDTFLPIFLKGTLDHQPDGSKKRRKRAPVRLRLQDGRERIADVFAIERAPARQHLVEHTAERPDVAALVGRLGPSPARATCTQRCRESRRRRSSSRAT